MISALIEKTLHSLTELLSCLHPGDHPPEFHDHFRHPPSFFLMYELQGMILNLQILIWQNLVDYLVEGMTAMAKSLQDDRDHLLGRSSPLQSDIATIVI